MSKTRTERDSLGEMEVPAGALYGASTQRAVLNFPVSGYRFGRGFIRALGLIKLAAASANEQLGKLDRKLAGAIQQAAREVVDGRLDEHFVVDIFQTGSGTSTNMNANEVIANRATQMLGGEMGAQLVHPNDHVNMGQSSNDVIPTAMHIAAMEALQTNLLPALKTLREALATKAALFDDVVKIGRTHLMDATPIRLGQEFSGYARQVEQAEHGLVQQFATLQELPLGGTAVGTGINTHPEFGRRMCEILNAEAGGTYREADNHFAAQAAKDAIVATAGALKVVAISLTKIANDIRLLGSGPRCGIGELRLPATQPGSSIMPGKVNPVICESVLQVCAQVVGADATVTYAGGLLGNLDLHVGMPVMAHNVLESVRLLASACGIFVDKCIAGLEVNRERCAELIEQSLAMCTGLAPLIGYDEAAAIAREASRTGRTVREVALERKVLDEATLNKALAARTMTEPRA